MYHIVCRMSYVICRMSCHRSYMYDINITKVQEARPSLRRRGAALGAPET